MDDISCATERLGKGLPAQDRDLDALTLELEEARDPRPTGQHLRLIRPGCRGAQGGNPDDRGREPGEGARRETPDSVASCFLSSGEFPGGIGPGRVCVAVER